MSRSLWLFVFILSAGSAYAEWTAINSSEDGIRTNYLDFATIRRTGNLVKVWKLLDLNTPQTLVEGTFLSVKHQDQYDCQEEQSRTLSSIWFSKNMGRGDLVYSYSDPGQWSPVAPETVGDQFFKIVCGKK